MIDIDFFKKINDAYGHKAGDDCLKIISSGLADTFRNNDIVARYGGEEFIAVIFNQNKDNSYLIAERVRHNIKKTAITLAEKTINVTVSIGGICCKRDKIDLQKAISVADNALYQAKQTGRDKVVFEIR